MCGQVGIWNTLGTRRELKAPHKALYLPRLIRRVFTSSFFSSLAVAKREDRLHKGRHHLAARRLLFPRWDSTQRVAASSVNAGLGSCGDAVTGFPPPPPADGYIICEANTPGQFARHLPTLCVYFLPESFESRSLSQQPLWTRAQRRSGFARKQIRASDLRLETSRRREAGTASVARPRFESEFRKYLQHIYRNTNIYTYIYTYICWAHSAASLCADILREAGWGCRWYLRYLQCSGIY